jgi:membrane protease YdiL (CAAX protease family)
MLAAIVTTAIGDGSAALRGLLARMVRWRIPARWYLAALVPAAAALLTLSAMAAAGYAWPSWSALREMAGLPLLGWFGVLALVVVINGYGEEVGWRGFVWSRLRESHSLGGAALILALPWALWHTPTFWLDTGMADLDLIVIPGWLTGLAAGSVVLGWLYERSESSLLVVALFHAVLNMASATTATEGTPAAVVPPSSSSGP